MNKYTTIFFDLDDTLWDTVNNAKESLSELYDAHNINRFYESFDDFYAVYSKYTTTLWEQYNHGHIDKPTLIKERFLAPFRSFGTITEKHALEMNEDFFARIATKKGLINGALEILDYLKPKYRMHIISNGFTELQDKKISGSGLGGYFDKVVLSDSLGINKPDPRIFNHLLNLAQTESSEVIMIGDNINTDILGAKNSGIDQIWFNPEQSSDQNNTNPNYEICSLLEIKNIL